VDECKPLKPGKFETDSEEEYDEEKVHAIAGDDDDEEDDAEGRGLHSSTFSAQH